MIVVDKASEAIEDIQTTDDPPPSYSGPSKPNQLQIVVPPMPKPTNFVTLVRKDKPIKGNYAINPYISLPASLLPPLEEGESEEERKNLRLKTKDGTIDVDVWVVGDGGNHRIEGDSKEKRAKLDIAGRDGSITVRLHSPGDMTERPPFQLKINSKDGSVQVHVPRSFRGPMVITVKDGSVYFSDELSPLVTTISELNHTRRCFVGDWSQSTTDWTGDEVEVYVKDGSVRILYEDEMRIKGFFRRIFGF